MNKRLRQYIGIFSAIAAYYLIHEGAHLITALYYGVFKQIKFLGLGIQPPDTSWGQMINLGRQYLYNAPWLSFAPCAAIMLIVLAFNFLGDGLRDVLDPHLQDKN